ncbi:5607_t:CDS:2, partial [Cetraspora pellucida]
WNETKDLNNKPKSGRKRITSKRQDEKIRNMAEKNFDITAAEIKLEIEKCNVKVSKDTIRCRLHEGGAWYMNPLSKPLLTERHRENHLIWANQHKNYDFSRVIFSDECTFRLNQRRRKVWTFPGFGKLILFQKNLNAKFMITIYEKGLLPSASKLFGQGHIKWVLQEDNDPKHRS